MLRLRSCILTCALSSPATCPVPSLQRLLSAAAAAAAPAASPSPAFAAEQYLIENCGLTRAQALKACTKLSHLKCPSKPDAVLGFLAGLGLSTADVATVVAKDPNFLCTSVHKTLTPTVAGLTALGLSRSEIASLVSLAPVSFRCRSIVSNLPYYLSLFGSYRNILRVLNKSSNILLGSVQKVVQPNVAFLQQHCQLDACQIAKLCIAQPWLIKTSPGRVQEMAGRAESLGAPRGSGAFRRALQAVSFLGVDKVAVKLDCLKNTFRWSDAEVGIAVCKAPVILTRSKDILQSRSEFLISEAGLEPAYIAHRPALLTYCLEGRLRPRYYVVKFLKANGLLDHRRDYYATVACTDKVFVDKFICPHKEAAPHLAQDYAAACKGEVPARFIFASTKNRGY